mgnify:CR=1 FL=1|nr:MAG TPA: hypothetical protein [Caudoviricetes sp.]
MKYALAFMFMSLVGGIMGLILFLIDNKNN